MGAAAEMTKSLPQLGSRSTAAAPMAHPFPCWHTRGLPEAELVLPTRGTLHYIISSLQATGYLNMDNLPQISISQVHMAWNYHHAGRDQRCAYSPAAILQ